MISVGAKPLAITNCLNFGNPENKEIMGEFAESLQGIREACEFLNYPMFLEMYLSIMALIKKIFIQLLLLEELVL